MKPLTFESIRNFLRTKKKGKDKDGIGIMDASFKRSDSFKRISIRKSYLDRGRKRAALRAKAIGASTGSSNSGGSGNHHCSPTSTSGMIAEELEANPIFKLDRRNDDYYLRPSLATTSSIAQAKANNLPAAVMTVPEVKNGIFIGSLRRESVAGDDDYNDDDDDDDDDGGGRGYNGANNIHNWSHVNPQLQQQETEVQVVSVDFQNSNSSETIYNDVLEEVYSGGANVSNVSVGSLQDDDRSVISEENIYEKADSVRLDQKESDRSKGITFKTFTPAKSYLETNFDTPQEELDEFPTTSSSKKSDSSSRANVSKTTLIYEDPFDHIHHRKQVKNYSGESIVIHISGTDNPNSGKSPPRYPPNIQDHSPMIPSKKTTDHYQKEPSGNAKCTYEIFKELQMSKNDRVNPPKKTISRSSSFSEVHYGISTISEDPDQQSPEYNKYQSFSFDPEVEMYDDADMISPDSSIPYPLRVKINPFTRQKELYAVNLGRIWKQLNLGQGDDLDMRGNFKKKNESFKSMSSRDSGFSLTLTKPKNMLRRRHAEGNKDFRFQRNSSRKRKSRRTLAPITTPLELNPSQDHFVKEFEEFCIARRRRMKARKEYADDPFNQEINDLEAFFEEHLKRLKEYYLQRKKINDATLSEIYADMSSNEQNFEFPHPDKRVINNKKKSKCLFQEVRTFNDEDHYEEDVYASIGNHRDTEDMFHYPKHWRMTSPRKRTLGRGRNTGRRYKKSDAYKSRKEISLASVFPSVYDSDAIPSSQRGGRRRQQKQPPPINPDGTCSYCFKRLRDASRRCSSIASDEFSEQEFLSNCDVCWNCDNHLADCICAPIPSTDYCSCRHAAALAVASTESPCGRKKIRRKKSKRKVGKNHSTLRRRCTGSDITQKGYEKKRSRLLQPYMTKGNSAGPLASNVKRSGVDLSSQLAALSAEIAAKSNFKGGRSHKNEQGSQSPLLQTRKYSGSGGSAGNSSASSSMEKQQSAVSKSQQQKVPLSSRIPSSTVQPSSHSILQSSANLLAPSAILAAVKSMQNNKVSKSSSGNIKTSSSSNNNNNSSNKINNNGNNRSKSESPSGTVLIGGGGKGVGVGHTGGIGGGRALGCVVGNSAERTVKKSDQSKNAQNANTNANAQCAQNNRPSRRLGRHESRYTSGKRNLIYFVFPSNKQY